MNRLDDERMPAETGVGAAARLSADDPEVAATEPVLTEPGISDERTLRVMQWAADRPLYMGWLAARLDRWGEFFGLESRVMQYWISAVHVLIFGMPGVALLIASLYVQDWDRALGNPLGHWSGYARLGVMFLGCYLLFLAWPRYIRRGQTVEQADAEARAADAAREEFGRKFRR